MRQSVAPSEIGSRTRRGMAGGARCLASAPPAVLCAGGAVAVAAATADERIGVPLERSGALARPAADVRASRLAAARAVALLDQDDAYLRPEPDRHGVAISVAHRAGRGAAAAARSGSGLLVGVDLEIAGSLPSERARYFMTSVERDAVDSRRDLVELWALKEAAWKALRLDDATPFHALELAFDRAGALCAVSLYGRARRAGAQMLAPWHGFVLAALWLEDAP